MNACCPMCRQTVPPSTFLVSEISASRNGVVAPLTPHEAAVLQMLSRSAPGIVRVSSLTAALYGAADGPEDEGGTLRVVICRLRAKLTLLGVQIVNAHARGYRLVVSLEEIAA